MTRRLVASYLLLALVALIALEIPLGVLYARNERQAFDLRVERDATTLASIAEDALEVGGPYDRLQTVVRDFQSDTGARAVVVDASGTSVADSDTDRPIGRDFSTRPEIAAALRGERAVGERGSQTLGDRIVYVAVPSASGGVVHGAVRLTVPSAEVDSRVRRYWLVLVGIAAVVMAAVAGVGWLLARSVSSPLADLEEVADRIGGGDLQARAPEDAGPGEVRALARRLNESTARLDAILSAQRDFVAEASHQLRTPLTGLRLRLENLEGEVPPGGARGLQAAMDEVDRMSRLVDGLLALARADAGDAPREEVDVAAVCADRHAAWEPLAHEEGRTMSVDVPPGLRAVAVPGGLEQILDNLIDNALRVAPAGTAVEIAARPGPDGVTVSVSDRGPGLDPAARAAAFERFWTTNAAQGGTGLGLAVVARLAEAGGGSARLAPREGGGLRAEVTLPHPAPARPA